MATFAYSGRTRAGQTVTGERMAESIDAAVAALRADGRAVTLGPLDFGGFIPGWKTAWVADPEGNIVEVSQGYVDQPTPPPLPGA